jgi:hypothetical protein
MEVKFLRTIITNFGIFEVDTVHELTEEQVSYLMVLNPDEIELVVDEPHAD